MAQKRNPKISEFMGWAIQDQMEELRGKYHLKKKNCEAYRESSLSEIKKNDHIICTLRQENKSKRIQIAGHENGDEKVIKTVFCDEREELLALQRYTLPGAVEEMDQRVCTETNNISDLLAGRQRREEKIRALKEELKRMRDLEMKSPEQVEAEQAVTTLENSLDKALIKYNTACHISKRYRDILEKLKEDSLYMPAKLDAMELALLEQKSELKELKSMAKTANEARDIAKRQLGVIEQSAFDSKRARDGQLNATRKEVEKRKQEAEKIDKKQVRASLIQDSQDSKASYDQMVKQRVQQQILSFEDAFERIKAATHVTCIEDVLIRASKMDETHDELKSKVAALEAQRNRLVDEVQRFKLQFHEMKYTGESKLSAGERLVEQMKDSCDKEATKKAQLNDTLMRNGDVLVKVRTGISTLLEKLDEIKLPPPHHSFTKGPMFDQLDLTRTKLECLLKTLKKSLRTEDTPEAEQLISQEFREFLEGQIPSENIRVKMQQSLSQLSEFGFDEHQENEVLSREDIKSNAQKLIDSKQQGKKKKKGKKNK